MKPPTTMAASSEVDRRGRKRTPANTPKPMPPCDELERLYLDERLSMMKLAKHYGVGIGVIHKWIHMYGIPARPTAVNVVTRMHRGVRQRWCQGEEHPEGAWVNESRFHRFWKQGRFITRATCMACDDKTNARQPYVDFTPSYKGWVESIVNRLGVMETCRRLGIHEKTLAKWRGRYAPQHLQRRHAKSILALMGTLRVTGEVRHRLSIVRGGLARGEVEREVKTRSDLYRPHGDANTEARRDYRRLTGK